MLFLIALLGCVGLDAGYWMNACIAASQLGKLRDWTQPLALGFRPRVLLPRYLMLFAFSVLAICANNSGGSTGDIFLYLALLVGFIYIPVAWLIFTRILQSHGEQA